MAVGAVLNHNGGLWALVGAYVNQVPQDIVNLDETLEERDKNTHFKALVELVEKANYDLWYFWVTVYHTPIQGEYFEFGGRVVYKQSDFRTELNRAMILSFFSSDRELLKLSRRDMLPGCTIKTAEAIRHLFKHPGVQRLLDCVKELQYGPEYDDPSRGALATEESAENPAVPVDDEAPLEDPKEVVEPVLSTADNQEEEFDPDNWPFPTSVVPEIRYCRNLEVLHLGQFEDFKGPIDLRGLSKIKHVFIQNASESQIKESDILSGPLPDQSKSEACVLL